MRRGRLSRAAFATLTVSLTGASVALGTPAAPSGRQPVPGNVEFSGLFEGGRGTIWLRAVNGTVVAEVSGSVPGTCRDQAGGTVPPARGGAIQFTGYTREARIGRGGAFAFRLMPAPQDLQGGMGQFDLAIRGTFHGNNVIGRVRGTSRKDGPFASCSADARFWAWRNN